MSKDLEFQEHEGSGTVDFGEGDVECVGYDDNAVDRILAGAKPKRRRIPKGKGGMRPATAQDIQGALARTPEQNRAALMQRIQQVQGMTGGYGQQPGLGYPYQPQGVMYAPPPVSYDDDYVESGPGGAYSSEVFPQEGFEGVAVGSWGSFWRGFKNVFKKIFKVGAKSGALKTALNGVSPGAGDAAEKGMKLIDSAASGNKDALAQVKALSDKAKSGDTDAQPAHDMLTTINDARKEAKTETVTAAVGAAMQDMYSLIGRYITMTQKKDGKEFPIVAKITRVHPEAYVELEPVGMPGMKEWGALSKLYDAMMDKKAFWSDENGNALAASQPVSITAVPVAPAAKVGAYGDNGMFELYLDSSNPVFPVVLKVLRKEDERWLVGGRGGGVAEWYKIAEVREKLANKKWESHGYTSDPRYDVGGGGGHHGGHGGGWGGMMRMDPRDLYWGPRVDFDDDGQPVFVGAVPGGQHGAGGHHAGAHRADAGAGAHHAVGRGGHHGGGGRGWGGGWGVPYAPWGGMWGYPMMEEVVLVEDEPEAPAEKKAEQAKATLKVMAGIATQDWTSPDWSSSDAGEEVKKLLEAAGIKKFNPAGKVVVDADSLRIDFSELSPKQQRKANNLMAMTAALCTRGKKIVVNVPAVAVGGGGGGGHHGGHHGGFPGGVMMGPGWGDYSPYPYPGADPWMFEEVEYQLEAGKKDRK